MSKKMVMGNEAIALGALCAGVNVISGYPGTPSSEIIEFAARHAKQTGAYIEWSVNEKAALEVAAGASFAGARTLVTMKQVGLNVAGDPAMCLSYVGVKGGMVIVSADDPGPISSQTEQDSRMYGSFSKIPVLDPSTPEEAFEMIQAAFELSEKYTTPVLLRPTTRVDHGYASMEFPELPKARKIEGFQKDTARWVIFPRTSFMNHRRIFERNEFILPKEFSKSTFNRIENKIQGAKKGIAAGGVSWCYVKEALKILGAENIPLLKIGTPYPFPADIAQEFLEAAEEILVIEELDPVIESELEKLCGKKHLPNKITGKFAKKVPEAGEFSVEITKKCIAEFLDLELEEDTVSPPQLPVRPPVLCAGCPHRASFYAVKQATKKLKTVYCGDIGCYTLGNAKPLDMCDTCLCMGADITMAQGFFHAENDRHCFSFIGDSTFFASGIPGVVNAVYNQAKQTICILDNSTTAMTGHQPHPGTGITMMGEICGKISIEKILSAIGVEPVITVNPFDLKQSIEAIKKCDEHEGVSAVIFKSPCIALLHKEEFKEFRKPALCVENTKCIGCRKCLNEIGCPALAFKDGKAAIDSSLCTGCSLCSQICPVAAIQQGA
ncbi:indolepyruvate ferredoxin oxidoreductase subunit alpha [Treponema sp.]|uniref:indolepyruvate ferredoxin oxidoreductase subunit alpha n=1 Tax=Treponema sp. TaxID=166 RepID=UPI003F0814FA